MTEPGSLVMPGDGDRPVAAVLTAACACNLSAGPAN